MVNKLVFRSKMQQLLKVELHKD